MSKVITFSTKFPSYHPRKGEPTLFVEQILAGLINDNIFPPSTILDYQPPSTFDYHFFNNCNEGKYHTIRSSNRWKVGDKFSPRIWSGKPYNSKQIIIAPDIEIKKIFPITIRIILGNIIAYNPTFVVNPFDDITDYEISKLAMNDGLSEGDFIGWFNKDFEGQVICWNKNINY